MKNLDSKIDCNNGKFLLESTEIKIIWNGMELEWKLSVYVSTKEIDAKWNRHGKEMELKFHQEIDANWNGNEWNWNGSGMEINGHPDMEVKINGMKWKRKGNEMERIRRTTICQNGFGNGMEWKWKWNGTHD